MTLVLTSPAFTEGGAIPREYTCEGTDISPPLSWVGEPPATKSFALIIDDPDAPDPRAPQKTWVHWVVYDIPPYIHVLPAHAANHQLPQGARQGLNDWGRATYGGPCPPTGRHRYVHKLYALNTVLASLENPTKARLLEAMKRHVLAESQLIGTYQMRK